MCLFKPKSHRENTWGQCEEEDAGRAVSVLCDPRLLSHVAFNGIFRLHGNEHKVKRKDASRERLE